MYDLDGDGVLDILVSTYDGEVLGFRDTVCPQIQALIHEYDMGLSQKVTNWLKVIISAGNRSFGW